MLELRPHPQNVAHGYAVEPTRDELIAEIERLREVLRMPIELHDNNPNARPSDLWDSWVHHPAGYKAAKAVFEA